MALVALGTDGGFMGTVSLIENDLESRPQLSPWLASLYVRPEFRGKGLGSSLIKEMIIKASESGERSIFLYTETADKYYADKGWTICERLPLHGTGVTVMKYDIRK